MYSQIGFMMSNDVIDPVDADLVEEIGTALHWTLLDAADLEVPIYHRWRALESTYQVAGQSHVVESCLAEHSSGSRNLGGQGYRLESILHSYAEASRAHAQEVAALMEEIREYNGAVRDHHDDPVWQDRLEHWRERIQRWKDQVNEQYHENDERCQQGLRGYIEGSLWRMDYRWPRGPRPTEEDEASWPDPDTPWFGWVEPPMIHFPMPLPRLELPDCPVFKPGPAYVEMVQTLEVKATVPDCPGVGDGGGARGGASPAPEDSGGGGKNRLISWGATEDDDGGRRIGLGAADEDGRDDADSAGGRVGLGGAPVEQPVEQPDGKLRLGGGPVEVPEDEDRPALGGGPVEPPELGGGPDRVIVNPPVLEGGPAFPDDPAGSGDGPDPVIVEPPVLEGGPALPDDPPAKDLPLVGDRVGEPYGEAEAVSHSDDAPAATGAEEDGRNGSGFLLVNTPGKTHWRS